jgi:hypothetical protein
VACFETISYTYTIKSHSLHRKRRCPTWPTSVTFATRDGVTTPRWPYSPRRTGIVNVNVEPSPTWLFTQIRPPWSSMNFRHATC